MTFPIRRMPRYMPALAVAVCILPSSPLQASPDAIAGIRAFNTAYDEAIKSQDDARVLALWASDGVTLLPGQAAVRGRKAIGRFLKDVEAQAVGWKVVAQKSTCHDIAVHGTWATEWCETHQVASRPDGKPDWEGWGKMALVLQQVDGRWLITQEMWNQGPAPEHSH